MPSSPNSYELPASMKRADVRPAPARPDSLRYMPAGVLALACLLTFCLGFAFHPYPERLEPGWQQYLAEHDLPLFFAAVACIFLAFVAALVAIVAGWERRLNVLVLILWLFAPYFFLYLGHELQSVVAPCVYVAE